MEEVEEEFLGLRRESVLLDSVSDPAESALKPALSPALRPAADPVPNPASEPALHQEANRPALNRARDLTPLLDPAPRRLSTEE